MRLTCKQQEEGIMLDLKRTCTYTAQPEILQGKNTFLHEPDIVLLTGKD